MWTWCSNNIKYFEIAYRIEYRDLEKIFSELKRKEIWKEKK